MEQLLARRASHCAASTACPQLTASPSAACVFRIRSRRIHQRVSASNSSQEGPGVNLNRFNLGQGSQPQEPQKGRGFDFMGEQGYKDYVQDRKAERQRGVLCWSSCKAYGDKAYGRKQRVATVLM